MDVQIGGYDIYCVEKPGTTSLQLGRCVAASGEEHHRNQDSLICGQNPFSNYQLSTLRPYKQQERFPSLYVPYR